MLMLAVARSLPDGLARCRNPPVGWGGPQGRELRGSTLGIIGGTGASGLRLRQICEHGFGMQVVAINSQSSRAELEALLAASDYVSVNCTLTAATANLLSTREFACMKDGAVLVNCARAGVVNRAALEAALDSGKLRGAGLDVWWQEPLPGPDDSLRRRPNVVGTPHLGASTQQFLDNVSTLCCENVAAILADDLHALKHRVV
jgi:phosphoglycerate dehydrogenase-like enzyme